MIYRKTAAGRQALKERSDSMPRKYHFPFLMIDGVRDSADVLVASSSAGFTADDLQRLVQLGFIEPVGSAGLQRPASAATEGAQGGTAAGYALERQSGSALSASDTVQLFMQAQHLATSITASLGLRGFKLNLAVERASNLAELRALLPKIQEAANYATVKPLMDLLAQS